MTTTGLGNAFSVMIVDWAGGSLMLTLVLVALASLILGMGLPVTASYIVLATLAAPAIAKLSDADRGKALSRLSRLLAPALQDSDGGWWADYVRLRFRAHLVK